ncbi:AAA-like domain-containing protein, partial [Nostoc sp. UCD121]
MVDQYIFSGSLPENASTYVTRQADDELYEALLQGQFCYVLNSRQSGKSSLRVRTMSRLGETGVECASIDLSSISIQTATQENWYADLIVKLIDSFALNVDFKIWWEQNQLNSPLLRYSNFLSNILLAEVQEKIVIFIDEIDSVLSLNFPTDDFFAFIRSCYNQRVDNPEYNRLTFCFLGVASPSSLIQDKNHTPFNIGKAISLKGFQLHEVEPLEKGLRGKFSNPQAVMQGILWWTGGQPFMTQKLCQFMVEESEKENPRSVEQVVRSRIIENWESQDDPEHLRTICVRLLIDEQRAAKLLGLYKEILQKGEIIHTNRTEQRELQLSGLVVKQQGKLKVYNRIYQSVYDLSWVDQALVNLRPYGEAFIAWINSDCQDSLYLLQGEKLQNALKWAKNQNLSYQDYKFLDASRELEKCKTELKLQKEKQDRQIVEQNFFNLINRIQDSSYLVDYKVWCENFLRDRLYIWLWLAFIIILSFTLRDIYGLFFAFKELANLPEVLRIQRLVINISLILIIVVFFGLYKTKFGHRHPGRLFLGASWSLGLASQLFATIRGFAMADTISWSLLFLSQAIFIPVRWPLHLLSQLGILVYYFAVNTALGLKTPIPDHPEIYNSTFILYIFWFCIICNFGVYLYDKKHLSEIKLKKEIHLFQSVLYHDLY